LYQLNLFITNHNFIDLLIYFICSGYSFIYDIKKLIKNKKLKLNLLTNLFRN